MYNIHLFRKSLVIYILVDVLNKLLLFQVNFQELTFYCIKCLFNKLLANNIEPKQFRFHAVLLLISVFKIQGEVDVIKIDCFQFYRIFNEHIKANITLNGFYLFIFYSQFGNISYWSLLSPYQLSTSWMEPVLW